MSRADVLVKICGLTRAEDIRTAQEAGADALGLVFAPSPRQVNSELAASLIKAIAPGCIRVGLFMNQDVDFVRGVTDNIALDLLQFHGSENNDFCRQFGLPFIKAVSMFEEGLSRTLGAYPDASGLLLDSHEPGGAGGTGKTFDWKQRVHSHQKLWLAGGLNPDNVREAIRQFQPYAVDVSSGVEISPGIKDDALVVHFVNNAKQALHDSSS